MWLVSTVSDAETTWKPVNAIQNWLLDFKSYWIVMREEHARKAHRRIFKLNARECKVSQQTPKTTDFSANCLPGHSCTTSMTPFYKQLDASAATCVVMLVRGRLLSAANCLWVGRWKRVKLPNNSKRQNRLMRTRNNMACWSANAMSRLLTGLISPKVSHSILSPATSETHIFGSLQRWQLRFTNSRTHRRFQALSKTPDLGSWFWCSWSSAEIRFVGYVPRPLSHEQ